MHFAMHAFSSHVEVLNKVTPIDLPVQSAVLFSLTGWFPIQGRGVIDLNTLFPNISYRLSDIYYCSSVCLKTPQIFAQTMGFN